MVFVIAAVTFDFDTRTNVREPSKSELGMSSSVSGLAEVVRAKVLAVPLVRVPRFEPPSHTATEPAVNVAYAAITYFVEVVTVKACESDAVAQGVCVASHPEIAHPLPTVHPVAESNPPLVTAESSSVPRSFLFGSIGHRRIQAFETITPKSEVPVYRKTL